MNLQSWAEQAEPGDRLTYHVGFLAADRERNPELDQDARVALWLAEHGFAELTQLRVGDGMCAYLITRTGEIMG